MDGTLQVMRPDAERILPASGLLEIRSRYTQGKRLSMKMFETTDEITGGMSVALALQAMDVTTVFTIPSAHNMTILRSIEDLGTIRVVGCRHEQGVLHSADAYARVIGGLGVAIVSGGPGTANTMGGLYEAHHASSPVLLITSQVETGHLGRGRGYVHEAEHQSEMLRTASKETVTVESVDDIATTVLRLGRAARSGRPRPTCVEIPLDLQDAVIGDPHALDCLDTDIRPLVRKAPDTVSIDEAVALLSQAHAPIIWAGGGVVRSDAVAALKLFAERWDAPVITSREGRGAISELDPRSLGGYATLPPMREFLDTCDVMLAVGTRFQMYPTAQWNLKLPPTVVHLDIDPTMIGLNYPAAASVIADAAAGLDSLTKSMPSTVDAPTRAAHLEAGRDAAAAARELVARQAGTDHLAISEIITRLRPTDGALVCDATVPAYVWGDRLVPVTDAGTSVRSTAAGIGPGMAMAVGAALAADQHTVLLQGDGGFMLGVAELATAVQSSAKVIVCLFDDHGYGMLRGIQSTIGDGSHHHVDLTTPDFTALASAFGAPARRVSDVGQFESAFTEALGHDGPTLIHVEMAALAPLQRNLGT
ncbi:thiamine pyrophosphate-dependent enzyme [Rhodococcus sp. OK302]|uniref:thiamine pyrophosphate-dependent enzyme n=1 Tax=Rhodococcus sp. OK302 TaxID=1882769 RepID=UPI000B93B2AC|nr:thiamine pyrophosphate-binding protein [Rhodococcus sp. OK302]OYD70779.1 acetolactate synthase-1/2/3 large subunit [Rhodococcus sp. OK302]